MTHRTAARRSAVVGVGLLGAVALAGTAQAQTVPAPGATLTAVTGAAAPVVDPLTTPLNQVPPAVAPADPVTQPVLEAVQQVTQTLNGLAPTGGNPPAPTPGPGGGTPTAPTPPAGNPGTAGGGQPAGPAAQPPAAQQPAGQQPVQQAAAGGGGYGVASVPDSLVRKLNALEQFSPRAGFASAANPMSLFGAPQVASLPPAVTADLLPTPLAVRPAGGALEQALPAGAERELPAVLVAIALTAVAGAGAAQVAVLRARRPVAAGA